MTGPRPPSGTIGFLAIVALMLPVLSGSLFSQEFPESDPYVQLLRAHDYVEQGRYQDAARLLVQIVKEYPDNLPALELLQRAFKGAKEYDKALEVVGDIERLFGRSVETCLSYGDIYLKTGMYDEARDHLTEALAADQSDFTVHRKVAGIYRSNGLYNDAIETYSDARARFKDSRLLSYELGQLHEISRNYAAAAREYYVFMVSDTSGTATGERVIQRLIEYVDDSEDMKELKSVFSDLSSSDPGGHVPRRFLADILVRQDSVGKAYELYKEVDRLATERGRYLIHFARRCLERGNPEIAAEACKYVLNEYPQEPMHLQARYVLQSAHLSMGHPDSAVADMHVILKSTPDPRAGIEAAYEIGRIYLTWLKNPDSAMVYFDEILNVTQKSGWHSRALLRKGDCHLMKGELTVAESVYTAIDFQLLPGNDQEYLLWIRAQAKFFGHEFDDAKKLYADLTVRFRKGMLVNDCLRKMLMITENTGFDQYDLGILADAEYLMVRSVYDSAETKLVQLSEKSGSNLADISAYALGELYLMRGEREKAISTFQKILDQFHGSFWRGEAQKQIADIYLAQGELQRAREAYLELLTDYDSVLLQEHARDKLRRIENPQL